MREKVLDENPELILQDLIPKQITIDNNYYIFINSEYQECEVLQLHKNINAAKILLSNGEEHYVYQNRLDNPYLTAMSNSIDRRNNITIWK